MVSFMVASGLIKRARTHAGLSQAALAARGGLSQSAIARYEAGGVDPSVTQLRRLVRACDRELMLSLEAVASDEDDAALLRNLSLTPSERLQQLNVVVRFILRARAGLGRG